MGEAPLSAPYRLDWQRMLSNLKRAGFHATTCARIIGCKRETLQRLARGECEETLFSICAALLDLHARVCAPQHDVGTLLLVAKDGAPKRVLA